MSAFVSREGGRWGRRSRGHKAAESNLPREQSALASPYPAVKDRGGSVATPLTWGETHGPFGPCQLGRPREKARSLVLSLWDRESSPISSPSIIGPQLEFHLPELGGQWGPPSSDFLSVFEMVL